jgi:hypothetical protein
VLAFDNELAYPGYYALLPSLGAAAVMAAGPASAVGRFLSLKPNVLLGKLSYSVYLWHWPVFVYYDYYVARDLLPHKKLWLIPVVLAIAYLSWRFVELPARRRTGLPRAHVAAGAAAAVVAACFAMVVVTQNGFPSRIPADVRALGDHDTMSELNCTQTIDFAGSSRDNRCIVGAPWATAARQAVIWGDSHARHLLPLLDIPAREQNLSIVYWSGCPPFIDNQTIRRVKRDAPKHSENCARDRRELLEFLAKTPSIDLVIVSNAWAIYPRSLYFGGVFKPSEQERVMRLIEDGLVQTIAGIRPAELPVLIIGDTPRPDYPVPDCAIRSVSGLWRKPCGEYAPLFHEAGRPTEDVLRRIAAADGRVYFLDTFDAMCGPEGCPIRVGDEIIYSDTNHLRLDLRPATRQTLVSTLGLGQVLSEVVDGKWDDVATAKPAP